MARINTSKMLSNDGYYTGGIDPAQLGNTTISIAPAVYDQYDFSVTEDPVLLQERKDTARKLYDIFKAAPFAEDYVNPETNMIKIPKEDIVKVFYYMKEKLSKVKTISAYETVIAINEFFDFNYDYVVKNVLSSKMLSEILNDYYENGVTQKIDDGGSNPLF